MRTILFVFVSSAITAAAPAEMFPRSEGETAAEKPIVLPDALRERVGVLVVGFTKNSSAASEHWETRLRQDYPTDAQVGLFRVAVLESVPSLFRGFVRRGIRKEIPAERRDSFVLLFSQESAWKKLLRYDAADDAYIVLLDLTGRIHWSGHFSTGVTEGDYRSLKARVDELLIQKKSDR